MNGDGLPQCPPAFDRSCQPPPPPPTPPAAASHNFPSVCSYVRAAVADSSCVVDVVLDPMLGSLGTTPINKCCCCCSCCSGPLPTVMLDFYISFCVFAYIYA